MAVTPDITDRLRSTSITPENSGNRRHEISNGNSQCQDSNSSSDSSGEIFRASVRNGVHKSQDEPEMMSSHDHKLSAIAVSSSSSTSGEPGKIKKMG